MLNALIKAENDLNHIRDVVRSSSVVASNFTSPQAKRMPVRLKKRSNDMVGATQASSLLLGLTYQSALDAGALTHIRSLSMASTLWSAHVQTSPEFVRRLN